MNTYSQTLYKVKKTKSGSDEISQGHNGDIRPNVVQDASRCKQPNIISIIQVREVLVTQVNTNIALMSFPEPNPLVREINQEQVHSFT